LLLRLRFDDDLTAQEIAKLLQFPSPFHVYRRVNALLGVLRRALEQRGFESAVP
jgi:DNA-directed RNA polymerase specialized sigma subunit